MCSSYLFVVCCLIVFPLGEPVALPAQPAHGDKGKGKKGKGQGQANVREFSGKCNKCGVWGHKAADCKGGWGYFIA